MVYKVIKDFADLQDNKHLYRAGDTFPRVGFNVTAERLAELASAKNLTGGALIVGEETAEIAAETKETRKNEQQPVKAKKARKNAKTEK
jgi:hypothetical protein